MFSNVPNKLVTYIFEFLDLKDYRSVLCVSKQFFFIINDHNKFWTRECFRQYISHDLGVYSEIYDDEGYRNCIKNKNFALPKSSWKKLLEEGIKHKANFAETLSQVIAKDRVDHFLAYVEEILKQPPIPMASLKRETIICNTRTLFQTKLSEVLYENSTSLGQPMIYGDEYKATIDELKDREGQLLQEMGYSDKTEILKARWYLPGTKNTKAIGFEDCMLEMIPELSGLSKCHGFGVGNVHSSTVAIQNQNSLLLSLYYCLVNILTHFCGVVAEYLDCVENVYDLLTEYTARWNAYVCTTLEMERLFETFTELMNKNYEALFEGYPSFPKFSIWRLMTKIWVSEVFEKSNFKLTLNESFLRVLSNHREKNIKQALNFNFNFNNTEKYCELPKGLYVGINSKQKKHSSIRYETYDKLNNSPHVCFKEVMDLEKQLLSGFVQSILDISLTEVNIHYLNCSDVPAAYPYSELEECFLMKSNDFYNDYQNIFRESPDYYCHFLKSDFSLFADVLIERTNFKLSSVQTENGLQFLKNFVAEKLSTMNDSDIEKIALQIPPFENQGNNLTILIENVFQAVIEEAVQPQDKTTNFYQLPVIDLEEEENCLENVSGIESLYCQLKNDKNLVKKMMMCFDEADPDFFRNFEFLCQRLEQHDAIKQNDMYIKEDNASKNIPFELGDVDTLFYDLNKNIDIQLLEKLYDDYKAFQGQQKNETTATENVLNMEEENVELPAFDGFNNMNNFGNNGFNMDIPDFQDIDLMDLPNLSLGRRENI